MFHYESRLFRCPGAGCGIRTNPHPPGSAAPPAERRPGLATHGLWEEGRGWEGKEEGVRDREIVNTHNQTGRVSKCRKRAYHAEDRHKGHSQSHRLYASRQNHVQCEHQMFITNHMQKLRFMKIGRGGRQNTQLGE